MKNGKINITFDSFVLRRYMVRSVIQECITKTLEMEAVPVDCEINVLITNDKGIHGINLASRNIDRPTDVLSFPMFEMTAGTLPDDWSDYIDPETELCPLGDMVISLERAFAQAKEFGHSARREIGYLTIHSMLHLLGYDHLDEAEQKKLMRSREEAIASAIPGLQR